MEFMNRSKRLLEIRNLVKTRKITNQEEMLRLLNKRGFNYTQATLSRDLKLLKAGKIADEERGHIYVLPDDSPSNPENERDVSYAVSRGILSSEYSGNMAVIKTLPGFASGIALRIDNLKAFEIIGTIAGDDTILVIARDGIRRQELQNVLNPVITGTD